MTVFAWLHILRHVRDFLVAICDFEFGFVIENGPCGLTGSLAFHWLTQDAIVTAWEIVVNIDSGNGLLPNSTKPLPEPVMHYCQSDPQQ